MLNRAIEVAVDAHKDHMRKLDHKPYIVHPIEVSLLVSMANADEVTVMAALLHDTIEDTTLTYEEIKAEFGTSVADLVQECSEADKSLDWHTRKKHALIKLNATRDQRFLYLSCADKLSNMRSIADYYRQHGNHVWDSFNAGYEDQKWFYREVLKALTSIDKLDIYKELSRLVDEVFSVPK